MNYLNFSKYRFAMLDKISQRTVRILIVLFYSLTIFIHILIIARIIPYLWVNGGMSQSYEAQVIQSIVSILIVIAIFIYVWIMFAPNKKIKNWQKRILYGIAALWGLGLVQQLFGTPFERYTMSIVVAVGFISHILLVRKIRRLR